MKITHKGEFITKIEDICCEVILPFLDEYTRFFYNVYITEWNGKEYEGMLRVGYSLQCSAPSLPNLYGKQPFGTISSHTFVKFCPNCGKEIELIDETEVK